MAKVAKVDTVFHTGEPSHTSGGTYVYLVHYFYMYYYISPIHILKIVLLQVLFKCEVDKFVSVLVPRDVKATSKAMNHMYQIERHLVENFKKTNKKLVELENAVFSVAALLTNGLGHILLVVAIKFDGQMIYRFIESGRYVGVMHNSDAFPQADDLYRVYTPEDVELYSRDKPHRSLFQILLDIIQLFEI